MNIRCVKTKNNRYIIVDEQLGNTIDDAQGYGYKSADSAWNYAWHQALNHNPKFAHLLSPTGKSEFMPSSTVNESPGLF